MSPPRPRSGGWPGAAVVGLSAILAGVAGAQRSPAAGALDEAGVFGNFSLETSKQPIKVTADRLEFDYKNRVVVYRGGVQVTQGETALHSETLTIRFDEHAGREQRLRELVAEGEVQVSQGPRSATGGRAVFDQAARTITLSDHAVLHDGPSHVAGERVVVYLAEGRSVVEGGTERVRAVLVQQPDQTTATATGGRGDE